MPKDANLIDVDIYDVTTSRAATQSAIEEELVELRLDRSCGICLDEFEKDVIATRMPCLHIFHGHCILRLLQTDHKCPLCRDLMPHDDDDHNQHRPYIISQESYHVNIEWRTCPPALRRSDVLHIQFSLYKSKRDGVLKEDGQVILFTDDQGIQLKTEPQLLTIPKHREQLQPTLITQVLKTMCVPGYEQRAIVAKLFEAVANNNSIIDDVPFINVDIYGETLELLDDGGYRQRDMQVFMQSQAWESQAEEVRINRDRYITDPETNEVNPFTGVIVEFEVVRRTDIEEELQTYKPRPKPASQSAIEKLERVKLERSCGICMEGFEEGLIATRFPCLHIFHRHCIISWLQNHHQCPLCQYPLPHD